jgi:hypothetical protein
MKKAILLLSFLITITLLNGCSNKINTSNGLNSANPDAVDVSIIKLISNPDQYDNKIVRVIGVGNLVFEGNSVYFNKDDLIFNVSKNGLWIELGENSTPYDTAKTFNGKHIIIEGTFNKDNTGHFGMWSGAIENISRYELWDVN